MVVVGFVHAPINALAFIAAVRTLYPEGVDRVIIAVNWPVPSGQEQVVTELDSVVQKITAHFPERITVFSIVNADHAASDEALLRKACGTSAAAEIFYPHDCSSAIYSALCRAFPEARRTCFGDALGIVYEKHVRLALASVKVRPDNRHPPDRAALILPVDHSGQFLRNVPLTVCAKELVQDIFLQSASGCSGLGNYIQSLLQHYASRRKYLLITENHAEAGVISLEREIAMYRASVLQHCTPGSVVFLKSHPGETLPRNRMLIEALSPDFEPVELDPEFKRYPIELWRELVRNATSICMSYPTLSLKYIFDIDVVQPMDDKFIETWFPRRSWKTYKSAMELYREPLLRLSSWDQKSVLWAADPSANQATSAAAKRHWWMNLAERLRNGQYHL
ncbi:MAG: hypothetical protein ACLPKB_14200 [Xanthobacteraceae bacterium]